MLQRLNEISKAAGADQGSERASTKSAKSRKNVLEQNPQPQVISYQQVHPQMKQQVVGSQDISRLQQYQMST